MSPPRIINLSFVTCAEMVAAFFAFTFLFWPTPPSITAPTQPSAITRLTYDSGFALHPAWSPDNQFIVFESNRDGHWHLYLTRADRSGQRALTAGTNDERHPAWTHDGKSILYDSSDGMRQDLWIINVADGARKQLTRVDGVAEYAAMSPDDEHIAFYVYKDMTLNLWSAQTNGGARPLTRDLADARRKEPTMAWSAPAWSPDGQWLAYTGAMVAQSG